MAGKGKKPSGMQPSGAPQPKKQPADRFPLGGQVPVQGKGNPVKGKGKGK